MELVQFASSNQWWLLCFSWEISLGLEIEVLDGKSSSNKELFWFTCSYVMLLNPFSYLESIFQLYILHMFMRSWCSVFCLIHLRILHDFMRYWCIVFYLTKSFLSLRSFTRYYLVSPFIYFRRSILRYEDFLSLSLFTLFSQFFRSRYVVNSKISWDRKIVVVRGKRKNIFIKNYIFIK